MIKVAQGSHVSLIDRMYLVSKGSKLISGSLNNSACDDAHAVSVRRDLGGPSDGEQDREDHRGGEHGLRRDELRCCTLLALIHCHDNVAPALLSSFPPLSLTSPLSLCTFIFIILC